MRVSANTPWEQVRSRRDRRICYFRIWRVLRVNPALAISSFLCHTLPAQSRFGTRVRSIAIRPSHELRENALLPPSHTSTPSLTCPINFFDHKRYIYRNNDCFTETAPRSALKTTRGGHPLGGHIRGNPTDQACSREFDWAPIRGKGGHCYR